MTYIEELFIVRIHICASIIQLVQRHNTFSFFGIKSHIVFLLQDTTYLIDLLSRLPLSLLDIFKVVLTKKSTQDKSCLKSQFIFQKCEVYDIF